MHKKHLNFEELEQIFKVEVERVGECNIATAA